MSSDIRVVIKEQKRRRRQIFWAGFGAIALIGFLWAGLSKDPRGPGFFDDVLVDDGAVFDEPEFMEEPPPPIPTTVAQPPPETTITAPAATAPQAVDSSTTGPPTITEGTTETTAEVSE